MPLYSLFGSAAIRTKLLPCLTFVILLLAISCLSMRQKGATSDEVSHLPAGYTYLTTGDFRLNPEHPPLIKLLASVPLTLLHPKVNLDDESWKNIAYQGRYGWDFNQWLFGRKFLNEWNNSEQLLFYGRIPIVLLSALLGIGVFFCAYEWYGWKAGGVALTLYLFNPDILAHSQLVTTDLGVAAFLFLCVYQFHRALCGMTVWNLLLTCIAAGLAVTAKFSGLLVFPMLLLVGAAHALSKQDIVLARSTGEWRISSRIRKMITVLGFLGVLGAASLAIIWASYGFRYSISPDPRVGQSYTWEAPTASVFTATGAVTRSVDFARRHRLVPEAYLHGLLEVVGKFGGSAAYLHGEFSSTGFRQYFLASFLLKTPLPFLMLIGLSAVLALRSGWARDAWLLLPPAFYFGVAILSNVNIGHRHILPIYPFLIVFASSTARMLDESPRRWLPVTLAVLLAWNIAETAFVYPHFLAYFNEIAGGPANGREWLIDSNLDWGQDLKGLASYRRAHPEGELYLCYFGNDNPHNYGMRVRLLPGWPMGVLTPADSASFSSIPSGAMVAVSATYLQTDLFRAQYPADRFPRVFPGAQELMSRLRNMKPIADIGYSILLYRMP